MRQCFLGRSEMGNPNFDLDKLTRHGVILGSTGSGKTAVGINILESCLLNQIPVIAIDPKGDIGNLLYLPIKWDQAETGRFLNKAGEDCEQEFTRFREAHDDWQLAPHLGVNLSCAVDIRLHTPGADHGLPLGLWPRSGKVLANEMEVSSLAQSLVSLVGIKASPVDPAVVMLEQVIWAKGEHKLPVTLEGIVSRLKAQQDEGLEIGNGLCKQLILKLDALSKSIMFSSWQQRPEMDIAKMLWNGKGSPCCSILNIAHLDNQGSQFVISQLLVKLISWMKQQSASEGLRAVLYIDECQGLIPAVQNPQTKQLLMTLIKQARAFGLGIILATQNPGDIDYKVLSNIGTWIVGNLKTDRDRDKVEQVIGGGEEGEDLLGGLQLREFVYHTDFRGEYEGVNTLVFKSRQTFCYLRGPMDQQEIKRVTEWRKPTSEAREILSLEKKSMQDRLVEWYLSQHFNPIDDPVIAAMMARNQAWYVMDNWGVMAK